jgi:hypothetical protein
MLGKTISAVRAASGAAFVSCALLCGCATGSQPPAAAATTRDYRPIGAPAVRSIVMTSWKSVPSARTWAPTIRLAAAEPAPKTDATTAASAASGEAKQEPAKTDAVTGASEGGEAKDAAHCLKCHGPFEKLAEKTAKYVTEWDEVANPHVYVPHDSKTIVECSECHDPHPIPFKPVEGGREPSVKFCYSCHHAETLVNCKQCHKE